MRIHDCEATMTDTEVMEFCRKGFSIHEAVVPDEINQRVFEYADEHNGGVPHDEDWYIENIFLNKHVVGSIRTLMGENFGFSPCGNHRVQCPIQSTGGWHRDGGSIYGPELDCLQVFYYPQNTPLEMGPTEVVPGSHRLFALQTRMAHYGAIQGAVSTTAPAGSIFITAYHIWHRRGSSTATGVRNLLKYWYVRNTPPKRDWVTEPGFELRSTYHAPAAHAYSREMHRTRNDAAEMFYWLAGEHHEYKGTSHSLPVYFA